MVWRYCQKSHGLAKRAQRLVSSRVPAAPARYPTGFCIQAFVATMKRPESHVPRRSIHALRSWTRFETFPSP